MAQKSALGIRRYFTRPGTDAYSQLEWTKVDSRIENPQTKEVVFEQLGVEFPKSWSLNAINIVTQKYFTGTPDTEGREQSLRDLIDRVVDTTTRHGLQEGYFIDQEEADTFAEELKYICATQRAAFNSPVWFNIGVKDRIQQASACFILAVEDDMKSILNWYYEEGMIFKFGSGAGVNLSSLRSSYEQLSESGGTASGPVSFMRGADASAGTIKSGGKTRRAAKMVILNDSHPDVEDFIWCKAVEERKARVLAEAGYDMDLDGKDSFSIQYQNANNSVRVSDEFMEAVERDDDWQLVAIRSGKPVKTVKARDLFRQIAEAAWECADPGMQFDTTINRWHTAPNAGRINGSNPCSEYMHLDNSACNLASLNLLKFLNDDGSFDSQAFKHAVEVVFTAQEILVGFSSYPTEKITANAKKYRELGIGYANLGGLLMARGVGYDTEDGRAWAATITAMMTGHAYATSAKIAKRVGPFAGFAKDQDAMINVLKMHRQELAKIDATRVPEEMLSAAAGVWDEAVELGERYGVRNSQASVLAPTGTIGLMMDCDTTGVEPDLGLLKVKKLVGGGTMYIVNRTIPRALKTLGYNPEQIAEIEAYIDEEKTIVGAPHLKEADLAVFATSMGDNVIPYMGHVRMMAAVQPFISGAISKTVNMPEDATVEDIEELHLQAWKMGIKAIAIYRDNTKVAQPLSSEKKQGAEVEPTAVNEPAKVQQAAGDEQFVVRGVVRRRELPKIRNSKTFEFSVADIKGYFMVGEFEDGSPGELFMNISKQGSTLAGIMDALAISVSHGLQYGVPLRSYVKAFINMNFAPSGLTSDPEIKTATSLVDYIFKRVAKEYLSIEERLELGLATLEEFGVSEQQEALPISDAPSDVEQPVTVAADLVETTDVTENSRPTAPHASPPASDNEAEDPIKDMSAPLCANCGNMTQRAGSCYVCTSCGSTTGCS